jgi:hypothetical protein
MSARWNHSLGHVRTSSGWRSAGPPLGYTQERTELRIAQASKAGAPLTAA